MNRCNVKQTYQMYNFYKQKTVLKKDCITKLLSPKIQKSLIVFGIILLAGINSLAQTITLAESNASLISVLDKIRNQCDYDYFITKELTEKAEPVTVNVKKRDLHLVLKEIFDEQPLSFSVKEKTIIVSDKGLSSPNKLPTSLNEVRGRVIDESGGALPGASVRVKNNLNIGTSTNGEGKFFLRIEEGAVLQISYAGYVSQDIEANGEKEIIVKLQPLNTELQEVVVVGYGSQKKASITGSVASIQAKELVKVKAPNVTHMLAGRLPGLRAVQRTSSPGEDNASVDIRGYGSMLVIVDGVQRSYAQLDPNDIESISILKDAAAAVYGFKGSNGVLIVTTKKGIKAAPKLEYTGFYGLQEVTRYPDLMNAFEYAALYNEATINVNPWNGVAPYTTEQLESYRNGSIGTNWWDEMVRKISPQSQHNLSVTGGTDKVTYYTSVGYMDQGGILKSGDWNFKRYNVRSNINVEVAKGLTADFKLAGRFDTRERPDQADELFARAQQAVPTFPIYANNNPDYWQVLGNLPNPIHTSYIDYNGYEDRIRREFNSSLTLNWKLPWVEGLQASALMAYDFRNSEWKSWRKDLTEYNYNTSADQYVPTAMRSKSWLDSKVNTYNRPNYQYSLNYNHTFASKHNVSGMLLYEMFNDRTTEVSGTKEFTLGLIPDLNYGDKENQTNSGFATETANAGLVGRFNYAYDSRYLMELTFRYDGSYKFRNDSRWGFFPGISAGWRISEEPFFKKLTTVMDNLKIRGSYAKVGDEGDFSAFQYLDGYNFSGSYVMGDQGLSLGLVSRGMANPWLTWYESKIMNFGFEASFMKGLLSTEFDWFRRNRSGLPATRQGVLPTTFGESMPQENLNSDTNTGFELSIGHRHNIGKLQYNVSANFSTTRISNSYIERAASNNMYDNWRNNSNERYKDIRWGREVIGQFTSYEDILNSAIQDNNGNKSLLPGDLKFQDFNGDGVIDNSDIQPLGHGSTPRMYYGLNLGANYMGFDLTVFLQGAAGHDIYISGDVLDPFIQQGLGNGFAIMTDRWHREDPTDPYSTWIPGTMPAARTTGLADNRSDNSWSLHTADYLRLKTLELGYTTPAIRTLGVSKIRVYANCNNLLTFTKRDGLMEYVDPESDQSRLRYYPQMKTFNFGVNITF